MECLIFPAPADSRKELTCDTGKCRRGFYSDASLSCVSEMRFPSWVRLLVWWGSCDPVILGLFTQISPYGKTSYPV